MASSFLRRANPFNPRYAMPGYVLKEPSRRAVTSPKMPRGWGGGPNVKVGLMMSRGYVDGHLPPDLAGLGSLAGPSETTPDPIAQFGQRAAQVILARTGNNVVRIRAALNQVGSGLVTDFDRKVSSGLRVEGALAAVLANRLLARAAGGNASLGDVGLPPPPTPGYVAPVVAGVRVVSSTPGQTTVATSTVVWSAAAKAIIGPYLAANPGAHVSQGVYKSPTSINMSDRKAFFLQPVKLSSRDQGNWNTQTNPSVNTRWNEVKNGTWWFYAKSGLLWYYNPSTKTLQIKSEGDNLFELVGSAIKKGVNVIGDLVGKIGDLACSAVNSSVASTAVVLGTGGAGAAGVAAAQAKCNPPPGGGGDGGGGGGSSSNTILLAVAAGAAVLLLAGRRGK